MVKAAPRDDVVEDELTVGPPKRWAAGIPGVLAAARALNDHVGSAQGRPHDAADQPARWVRLPRMRMAGAPRHVAVRVLRERCQGRRRGGDGPADHRRLLRRSLDRGSGDPLRLLARPTGAAHRANASISWRHALPADLVGWCRCRRRRPAPIARLAGPRRLLHVRADEQRGRLPVPVVRPRLRHEQSAGLLEHVPRVERGRPRRDDRHRQGHRHARRRPCRRADRRRRAEPGYQPSAHARGAGTGQAQWRGDRVDQPVARGRPDRLPQPAAARRLRGASHRPGRPPPPHRRRCRPRPVPMGQPAPRRTGRGRPALRRRQLRWASPSSPPISGPSTRRPCLPPPGSTDRLPSRWSNS